MSTQTIDTPLEPAPVSRPFRERAPKAEEQMTRGAKLICIDDRNLQRHYTPGAPIRGHIYCLRQLYTDGGRRGVLLVGITGPLQPNGLEQGFYLSRFRWMHD